jgi:glutamine amidotransferase
MCELFALSSQNPTRVTFSLEEFSRHGGGSSPNADGWGLVFYQGSDAQIFREPRPAASSEWLQFLLHHPYSSRRVLSHIRHAQVGDIALRNTQPFSRVVNGHRHVFCHNGDLSEFQATEPLRESLPVGETDSEHAFCWLIDRTSALWQGRRPTLEERISVIGEAFRELAVFGSANILYSDSDYLYAFANRRRQPDGVMAPAPMYYLQRHCECDPDSLDESGLHIDDGEQNIVLFASVPLTDESWHPFVPGQLIVARRGRILS